MNSEVAYEAIKKSDLWGMVKSNSEADDLADYFGAIASLTENRSFEQAIVQGLIDAEVQRRTEAMEAEQRYTEVYR